MPRVAFLFQNRLFGHFLVREFVADPYELAAQSANPPVFDLVNKLHLTFLHQHLTHVAPSLSRCTRRYLGTLGGPGSGVFPCPTCRSAHALPAAGASGLQTNFVFNKMLEKLKVRQVTSA